MNHRTMKISRLTVSLAVFAMLLAFPEGNIRAYFSPITWPVTRYGQIFIPTIPVGPGFGGPGAGGGGIAGGFAGAGGGLGGGTAGGIPGWKGSVVTPGGIPGWKGGGLITGGGAGGWAGSGKLTGSPGILSPPGPKLPVSGISPGLISPSPFPGTVPGTAVSQPTAPFPTAGVTPSTVVIPWSTAVNIPTAINPGTTLARVYPEPPSPAFINPPPLPITRNYVNLDCMGVYAPVDPHNFAVVNNFFRGGIYTGAVTQTSANVETITTPVVQPIYSPRPPVSAVDLNSISYTPAVASNNVLFATPFVNIYGPRGELLSGIRDASAKNLIGPGSTIPWQNLAPPLPLTQPGIFPALCGYPCPLGYLPAPVPPAFVPFPPHPVLFGFPPVPGLF